jgi:hypothetical protein
LGPRLHFLVGCKIKQEAGSIAQKLAEPRSILELEIGCAEADQRMITGQIVVQRSARGDSRNSFSIPRR